MIPRNIEENPEINLRRSFKPGETRKYVRETLQHLMGLKIVLYGTAWCPDTRRVRAFLESRGLPFTEVDIELDIDAGERLFNGTGRYVVPFVHVNDQFWVRGFDTDYPTRFNARRAIAEFESIAKGEANTSALPAAGGPAIRHTTL